MAARQDQISRMVMICIQQINYVSFQLHPSFFHDRSEWANDHRAGCKGHIHIADFFFTSLRHLSMMTSLSYQEFRRPWAMSGITRSYRFHSILKMTCSRASVLCQKIWVPTIRFGICSTDDKAKAIYTLGAEGYKQSVLRDAENDINHSGRLILVDGTCR